MSIDLRSLRYFVAVAAKGSISKAAEEVHVAQPALSLHMKKIEEELGVRLLERTAKGIVLTTAGQRFLGHSQDVLSRLKFACEDVRDSASEPMGPVSIGMPQSTGMALTVRLVQEVLRRWPRLNLQIIESSTGHIPDHLINRNVDLGITFLEEKNGGLRYRKLIDEELVLLGPPGVFGTQDSGNDHRQLQEVDFHGLSTLPLFLPSLRHSLRQLIDRYASRAQTQLKVLADVDAVPQLISLVAGGLGYTILSYPAVRPDLLRGRVSAARLVNPHIERHVFLCRLENAPASNAVLAMEALIVETVENLVLDGKWIGRPSG
ncbi:MAG: LysR family transcriptional regulator [Achromobacter veterisilvae]